MRIHTLLDTRHQPTAPSSDIRRMLLRASAFLLVVTLATACEGADSTLTAPLDEEVPVQVEPDVFDHLGRGVGDEAGVMAVVAAWDAAWNAGDVDALVAPFVSDAEFVNGRGQVAKGIATIMADHRSLLAGQFFGTRTKADVRRITFLTENSAVVDVDSELTGYRILPPGAVEVRPGVRQGRHKRVVTKVNGQWRVVSMQITNVQP